MSWKQSHLNLHTMQYYSASSSCRRSIAPLIAVLCSILLLLFSLVRRTDAILITQPRTFILKQLGDFSFQDSIYLSSAQSVSLYSGGFGWEHGGKLSLNVTISGTNATDIDDATLIFSIVDSDSYRYMRSARYDESLVRMPDICQEPSLVKH